MPRFIQTSALTVALVAVFAVLAAISSSQPEVSAQGHANAPSGLTASILGNGIGLNWIVPSRDAASVTGYRILRRRPLQGETSLLVYVSDTGSTSRTYIDTTATEPGERYAYRVKAWRGDELSRRSNFVRVDLPKSDPDPTPAHERSHDEQEEPEEEEDDSESRYVSFSNTAYVAAENGGIAVLRIQLSEQAAGRGVKVYYATESGSAEEYYDYIPVSHGSATILNTHTFADIEIELVDDDTTETTETFYVRITGVQYGAVLSENTGALRSSVAITDADKTKLYLSGPTEVTEGSGVHQVTIRAVPPIAFDIGPILSIGTLGTTATGNLDYLHGNKTALLPAYETVAKTTFTIYDDSVVEGDEVLVLQLLRNNLDQDISVQEFELRVTIRDNTPLVPTNLEITGHGGSENQYHATLRWNYDSDADGYLLDSRKGTSGAWHCVVAGGYPSDSDSDSIQVTTLRGGYMEAGEDWYFRVRSINAHEYAVVDEATCDENAEYGYVHSDRDNEGFTLSGGLRIGPENIGVPAESPPISDLDTPTGFRIVSAQSGRVELDWDNPTDNGATTGYVIKRQWMGEHLDANGNARNNPDLCIFFPANTYRTDFEDYYVRAYDSAGQQNQYRYRLYAVNSNFSITPDQNGPYTSCDRTAPDNTPAEAVATLDLSPAIQMRNGQYTLLSPSAPTGISLSSRYWGQHDDSTIRIIWESAFIEPAFQIEHREVGEDWEEPVVHTSENFPSMLLADRTLFTPPQSSLVLPRSAIDPSVQYQIRVGTCTTVVCDDVVYSSIRTIRAATSSSPR